METLIFKTTIKCGGCVQNVTPFLDGVSGIESWSVDTNDPDKFLTVRGEHLSEQEIINAVAKAGYGIRAVAKEASRTAESHPN